MRSKVLLSMVVGAASLLGSAAVQAQEAPPVLPPPSEPAPPSVAAATGSKKLIIGADLAFALPVGDLGDAAGFGIGLLPRFEFTLAPKLNLTARLGYVYHLKKSYSIPLLGTVDAKLAEIPVLLGAKYDLTDALYGAVELGLVHSTVTTTGTTALGNASTSDSDDNPAATIGLGYRAGDADLRLGLHILDLGNAGKSMELVLNVGYNFWRG